MPLSKTMRRVLIALCGVVFLCALPFAFMIAGNFGSGILDLLLNRRPTTTELIGDYKLEVPWGLAFLHIDANGTFKEEIIANGETSRTVLGRWQAKQDINFLDTDFRPFGMVWDNDHERETNIYGINFYKPHFGTTYGVINDDLGEKFVRLHGDSNGK